MRIHSRLLLAALAATALLSVAIASASARRFEVSNQAIRAAWTLLRFEIEGSATVECPVTLEGSFHGRTLSKVSGMLVGVITRAFVRGRSTECNGTGTARANTETLPWHVQYLRFLGILPVITEIELQLIRFDFNIDPASIFLPNCRMRTEQLHPAKVVLDVGAGGLVVSVTMNSFALIPLPGICEIGGEARLRGSAEVFPLGTLGTIFIRLVQ